MIILCRWSLSVCSAYFDIHLMRSICSDGLIYHSFAIALASTQHKHSPQRIIILDLANFFLSSFFLSLVQHFESARLPPIPLSPANISRFYSVFDIWFLLQREEKIMNAKSDMDNLEFNSLSIVFKYITSTVVVILYSNIASGKCVLNVKTAFRKFSQHLQCVNESALLFSSNKMNFKWKKIIKANWILQKKARYFLKRIVSKRYIHL